jgi:glycosyltransferase involved in cell wall biosynthesis
MSDANPRVSVCIPTRDRPDYLRLAVTSVLTQSFSDFELIISDNSHGDETAALVKSFPDKRIKYFRQHEIPLANNWIFALTQSCGEYCSIFGDDDLLEPEFLTRLIEPMERDASIDISFCDHNVIDESGARSREQSRDYSRAFKRDRIPPGRIADFTLIALASQSVPIGSSLIRRDRLFQSGGLDPQCGLVIDYYAVGRLALLGGAAHFSPERLMSVRMHGDSASSTQAEQAWRDMQWACSDLQARTTDRTLRRELMRKLAMAIARESLSARHRGLGSAAATVRRGLIAIPRRIRVQVAGLAAVYSAEILAARLHLKMRGQR